MPFREHSAIRRQPAFDQFPRGKLSLVNLALPEQKLTPLILNDLPCRVEVRCLGGPVGTDAVNPDRVVPVAPYLLKPLNGGGQDRLREEARPVLGARRAGDTT